MTTTLKIIVTLQKGRLRRTGGGLALATGGTSILVGAGVAAHGAAAGAVATSDAVWATGKLQRLHASSFASTDAGTSAGKLGPNPNKGKASDHGGTNHNKAIDDRVGKLKAGEQYGEVRNIRKNQVQVDANGKRVGNNRPDLQYDQWDGQARKWKHYNVEYDNNASNSAAHGEKIRTNDPNAGVELNILKD